MAVFASKSAAQAAIRDHVPFFCGVHAGVSPEKIVGMDSGFTVRLVQAGRGDGAKTAVGFAGSADEIVAFIARHGR